MSLVTSHPLGGVVVPPNDATCGICTNSRIEASLLSVPPCASCVPFASLSCTTAAALGSRLRRRLRSAPPRRISPSPALFVVSAAFLGVPPAALPLSPSLRSKSEINGKARSFGSLSVVRFHNPQKSYRTREKVSGGGFTACVPLYAPLRKVFRAALAPLRQVPHAASQVLRSCESASADGPLAVEAAYHEGKRKSTSLCSEVQILTVTRIAGLQAADQLRVTLERGGDGSAEEALGLLTLSRIGY